jgi:sporulation and spore germination protein
VISRKLQYAIVGLALIILAMGFYLVHLKRKAESTGTAPPAEALAPPPTGPTQQMTLYVAGDDDGSLRPIGVSSALPADPSERARLALHTLIARCVQAGSPHPLGAEADVKQVYLLDPASAVVNLNTAFADSHRSGVQVEQLSIFSMVLTLKAQLPAITRVRFLVDGKSRETLAGHVDLGGWLDVALVTEAAQQQLAMEKP